MATGGSVEAFIVAGGGGVFPGKDDPVAAAGRLDGMPPRGWLLADPDPGGDVAALLERLQSAPCFVDVIHHEALGDGLIQKWDLQAMAEAHRQHKPASGNPIDAAEGRPGIGQANALHRLIKVLPAQMAHAAARGGVWRGQR